MKSSDIFYDGFIEASALKDGYIAQLLLGYGFDVAVESTWVHAKTARYNLFFNIAEEIPSVDVAGVISLRPNTSFRRTLRFLNRLNNTHAIVRFSLWEHPSSGFCDPTELWGDVAVPTRWGFSARHFITAVSHLCGGLDYAHAAAVEAGLADPEGCTGNGYERAGREQSRETSTRQQEENSADWSSANHTN